MRLIGALALVLLAGSATARPGATQPALTHPQPCPDQPGFTCSTLTVPRDHSGRTKGTLQLQVAVADNAGAPRGFLLLIAGGPGQPGVPFAARLSRRLGPVAAKYRVVLYDQRGTGAGALRCPELQDEMGASDLYPPSARAVQACAAWLGPSRSLFGTDDVVADMDLLRRALHAEKWTLDGISYGTFVGERYAIAHAGRVKRLVLDSVVPHSGSTGLVPVELREVARVLRSVCAASSCPGDPAEDLARTVEARHDGTHVLDALTLLSVVDPTYRAQFDVPTLLHDAAGGNKAGLDGMLATVHRWEETPAEQLSQGLHASALCADWRFPWGSSATPLVVRAAALAGFRRGLKPADVWPFDAATAAGNGIAQQCLPWAPTPPTPAAAARLPNVPTLLLAGDRDLSTPLAWAKREAALAPNGRLVVVPGAGHSVQSRAVSDAGRLAVRRFLDG
jgi:pimeloyl-ACP methyl ester carboxylesterase